MNLLAKHFFDYQSFVNLPHKAIQLHKTPPSQAGVDPSASWAPKSMHVAGKNQPAPAARANRHHVKPHTGNNRHGRPSKMEYRNWGERHGELHAEKTVPHKDAWMVRLQGDFKHFYEYDESFDTHGVDSAIQHFPMFSQRCVEVGDIEVLAILTLTSRKDFITVTIKGIRNFSHFKSHPFIRVQLFDGGYLIEERFSSEIGDSYCDEENCVAERLIVPSRRLARASASVLSRILDCKTTPNLTKNRRISRGYGKIIESKMHPNVQLFRQPAIIPNSNRLHFSLHLQRNENHVLPLHRFRQSLRQLPNNFCYLNHNGGPAAHASNSDLWQMHQYNSVAEADNRRNQIIARRHSLSDDPLKCFRHHNNNQHREQEQKRDEVRRSTSPSFSTSHTTTRTTSSTTILSDCYSSGGGSGDGGGGGGGGGGGVGRRGTGDFSAEKTLTTVGESFMFRTSPSRINRCHILVQVYVRAHSPTPPPPPSSADVTKIRQSTQQNITEQKLMLNKDVDLTFQLTENNFKHLTKQNSNNLKHQKWCVEANPFNNKPNETDDSKQNNQQTTFNGFIQKELNLDIKSIDRDDESSVASNIDTKNLALTSNLHQEEELGVVVAERRTKIDDSTANPTKRSFSEPLNEIICQECALSPNESRTKSEYQMPSRYCCLENNPLPDNSPISEYNALSQDYSQELERLSEQLNRLYSNDSNDSANGSTLSEFNNKGAAIEAHSRCSEFVMEDSEVCSSVGCAAEHIKRNETSRGSSMSSSRSSSGIVCNGREEERRKVLVGGLVIGPLGSSRGRWHWRQMVKRHGFPVCMWHQLIRPTIPFKSKMHPTKTTSRIFESSSPSAPLLTKANQKQRLAENPTLLEHRCMTLDSSRRDDFSNANHFSISAPVSMISSFPFGND